MSEWRWHERGVELTVDVTDVGTLRVELAVDGGHLAAAELPPRAVVELAEWLDTESGHGLGQRLAEVEAECAQIEEERDAALAEVERLRALVRPDEVRTLDGRTR
jgi:hypothetical protein